MPAKRQACHSTTYEALVRLGQSRTLKAARSITSTCRRCCGSLAWRRSGLSKHRSGDLKTRDRTQSINAFCRERLHRSWNFFVPLQLVRPEFLAESCAWSILPFLPLLLHLIPKNIEYRHRWTFLFSPTRSGGKPCLLARSTGGESQRSGAWGNPNGRIGISKRISRCIARLRYNEVGVEGFAARAMKSEMTSPVASESRWCFPAWQSFASFHQKDAIIISLLYLPCLMWYNIGTIRLPISMVCIIFAAFGVRSTGSGFALFCLIFRYLSQFFYTLNGNFSGLQR